MLRDRLRRRGHPIVRSKVCAVSSDDPRDTGGRGRHRRPGGQGSIGRGGAARVVDACPAAARPHALVPAAAHRPLGRRRHLRRRVDPVGLRPRHVAAPRHERVLARRPPHPRGQGGLRAARAGTSPSSTPRRSPSSSRRCRCCSTTCSASSWSGSRSAPCGT